MFVHRLSSFRKLRCSRNVSLTFCNPFHLDCPRNDIARMNKLLENIHNTKRNNETSRRTKTKLGKIKSSKAKLASASKKSSGLMEKVASLDTSSVDIFQELGLDQNSTEQEFLRAVEEDLSNQQLEQHDIFDDTYLTKRNLLSYIHVCIFNDQLAEAHGFLLEFIAKFSRSFTSTDIAKCCELLIKGWARKGNADKARELIRYVRSQLGVKPSLQVYEYYLLAMAKRMREVDAEAVGRIIDEMKSTGHATNHLFTRSTLNREEIKLVKKFLERHSFNINFQNTVHSRSYQNKLVDNITRNPQQHYDPFEGVQLEDMPKLIEEQFDAEKAAVVKVKPIGAVFYDTHVVESVDFYRKLIGLFESDWTQSLAQGFDNYLQLTRQKHKRVNGIPFVHYMTILEPEFYVSVMLEEIRKCASFSEHYSPFAAQLFETLGEKIMSQYLIRSNRNDHTLDDFRRCYEKYVAYTLDPKLIAQYNPREYWQHLLDNGEHYYFDETKSWPKNVLKEIGKDLYEVITSSAMFDSKRLLDEDDDKLKGTIQPVISFVYKNFEGFKTKKEIRVHPLLVKLYQGANSDIHFEVERMPMIVPPVPWISPNFGGNLLKRDFIIRLPANYPRQRFKKLPEQQLWPTFDSLNALALCPWRINKKILDLAIEVFKNKGDPELEIPTSLSYFGPLPKASAEMNQKERAYVYHQRKMKKKEQAEMYSLWVDCLYKLSIGNYLRDRVFWFPINTDFRSRVYPIPPNFNHLGSDLSRSLLLFAKGKPLGAKGLDWLKIHLINLTGLKKRSSAAERLAYANEIMDTIIDSADHPFHGKRWWMQSDEKWQTLACCMEIAQALRSAVPEDYVSHMPIHQDGSCNGLQHYAALGRDELGARSVNLVPEEYPQDVYSDVSAIVQTEITKDVANNVAIADEVKDVISRKIVKQTVMTYVYGVTKYGAKLQVLKRLKEDANFPEAHKITASLYISEKILFSIRQMFMQTREIQDWLAQCAQIISFHYNQTVDWVTPLGFLVVQSYYKNAKKNSPTKLVPNMMKQRNAFPANFIHSLDSSHMMLTALECHRNGLTFASVHDCYWTHACHIDQMNLFCRRQFVALHSQHILDNLAQYLTAQVEGYNRVKRVEGHEQLVKMINKSIPKGEFQLNSVMDSVYFFS